MSGHRPFGQLRKRMSPERRARNAAATTEMLAEMALHELRQARERPQEELARAPQVGQPAVAKLDGAPTCSEQSAALHRGARRLAGDHRVCGREA